MAERLWVYGITEGEAPDRVEVVGAAGLTALVRRGEFDEETLKAELEDMARLEALARDHQRVLASVPGPVLPCPMCTIHSSEDSLAAMLTETADDLRAALDRVRGAAEWGVKSYWGRHDDQAAAGPASSGAEYLMRKRAARVQSEARREAVAREIAEVHERLAAAAEAAVVNRPQDKRIARYEGEMLLNAAYLVPDARAEDFRALLSRLAAQHEALDFELTGPWPPYHFAGVAA